MKFSVFRVQFSGKVFLSYERQRALFLIIVFYVVYLALFIRVSPERESDEVRPSLAGVIHKRANAGPLVRPTRSGKTIRKRAAFSSLRIHALDKSAGRRGRRPLR